MSDPYGANGPEDRSFHEQETTAQPAVDPHGQQGQPLQYGQPPQGYPQQPSGYGAQGYQQPYGAQGTPYAAYQPTPTNGLALASLITSIAGIFVLCGLSGIVAVVLGVMGLKRSREIQEVGRGQAIAGIVIGAIQVVLLLLFVAGVIIASLNQPTTGS